MVSVLKSHMRSYYTESEQCIFFDLFQYLFICFIMFVFSYLFEMNIFCRNLHFNISLFVCTIVLLYGFSLLFNAVKARIHSGKFQQVRYNMVHFVSFSEYIYFLFTWRNIFWEQKKTYHTVPYRLELSRVNIGLKWFCSYCFVLTMFLNCAYAAHLQLVRKSACLDRKESFFKLSHMLHNTEDKE